MSGELCRKSAMGMALRIRSGEVSSRELIEAHLARIAEVNPHLNAIVRVLADDACAGADAAGAIPIGRTNLADFGLRVHADSVLHGLTRNPWNPNLTTGGSCGGEAAAISSGMSPIGLGNDLGGSLRNLADCCGISSIKPTTGFVPSATCVPPVDKSISFQIKAVEGVLGRHIADVRTGFNAVAGVHTRDPLSIPARLCEMPTDRPVRIAVLPEPASGSTDAGIAAHTCRAADAANTFENLRPVLPLDLLGPPVAVTPAGLSAGMPVDVQVIGDRFHDLSCLSIAELIDQSLGVLTPIDPVLR